MYWIINQANMLKGACLLVILFGIMLFRIGCNILYLSNQAIHNLGRPIQNSLVSFCFGKNVQIPVFSLTGNLVFAFSAFPVQLVV